MWIDTDLGSHSFTTPSQREVALSEFPSRLLLQAKSLILRAVIAFQGGLTQDALGHYVAYCKRAASVWEMYDDLGRVVKAASENTKICSHAVLYTKE